jgi:hypothetical protein
VDDHGISDLGGQHGGQRALPGSARPVDADEGAGAAGRGSRPDLFGESARFAVVPNVACRHWPTLALRTSDQLATAAERIDTLFAAARDVATIISPPS